MESILVAMQTLHYKIPCLCVSPCSSVLCPPAMVKNSTTNQAQSIQSILGLQNRVRLSEPYYTMMTCSFPAAQRRVQGAGENPHLCLT